MRRGTGNKEIFRLMEMNNKMKQLPNSLESPFLDQEVLTAEPRQESGPGITRLAEEGPFEKDSIQSNETDLAAFTQEADPGHWVSENERLWDTEDEDAHEYRAEMYEDMGEVAPAAWSLRVIDESGKAIDGEAYAVYQEGAKANGTLTVGRANMGRIDPGKPFRFELKGRACAIQAGALLVTEAPSVEYGGTAVDWQEADAANADTRFWRDYEAYRTSTVDAPASFWQHEHITRRLIRLRKKWAEKRSAMPAVIVAAPVKVRVGPFVRYTNANTAVIWVETHTPALVRVRFGKAAAGSPLSERHAATVRVGGRHFALVALEGLAEATRYKYTLELAPLPAKMGIPTDEAALASATRRKHGDDIEVRVEIDRKSGEYKTFRRWKVFADDSTELEFPERELRLEDAVDVDGALVGGAAFLVQGSRQRRRARIDALVASELQQVAAGYVGSHVFLLMLEAGSCLVPQPAVIGAEGRRRVIRQPVYQQIATLSAEKRFVSRIRSQDRS